MTQVLHIHSWTTSGISKNSQYCDSEVGYWCSKCTVFLSKNYCPRKPLSHLSAEPMPCGPQEEHHGGAGRAAFPRLGDEARTSPRSAPQQVLPRRSQNVQARVSTSQAPRSFLRVRVSPPPHPTKVLLWDRGSEVAFPRGNAGQDVLDGVTDRVEGPGRGPVSSPRQHSGRHGRPRGRALERMPLARKARTCVLAAIRATLPQRAVGPWGSRAPSAACCAGRTREVGAAVPGTCPWMTPLKAATGVFGKQHVLFEMRFFFLDTLSPPHPDTESSASP